MKLGSLHARFVAGAVFWTVGLLTVALALTLGSFAWSLSNLVALLRMNLFAYRDLWTWLNEPFTAPPPRAPEPTQGVLI